MPRLLFHVDPSCEDGRFSLPTHVGDCVHVHQDGDILSDLERKHYLVVETDKPYDDCIATFLASGVPDDVAQAATDSMTAMRAASDVLAKTDPKDVVLVALAQKSLADAQAAAQAASAAADPTLYPHRRVKIDVSQIDPKTVAAVSAFKAAVDAARPAAYEAKDAAVAAVIQELGLSPSAAAKILNPDPSKAVDLSGVATDAIAEQLRVAALDGWAASIEPVEQSFAPLDPVVIDAKTLDALVIVKDVAPPIAPSPVVKVLG